jgi:DMSO/TMAO reductase YedYZ heme-binding membrane subunit
MYGVQTKKPTSLLDNSRFYVLSITVFISLILYCGLRIFIVDSRLRGIRLQQLYGLCAVLYWYVLMVMSAGSKVIDPKKWVPPVLFTRRALGVSVAYFAVLHFYIAITEQLDGWHGIWLLPMKFRFAVLFGFLTLLTLVVMAALSIDKVVALLKFRYWKILGRVSYIAGMLIILHVWIIGTHVASVLLQLVTFQMLALLFGLEAWRFGKSLNKSMSKRKALTIGVIVWLVLTGGLLVMRAFVPSYSNNHTKHLEAGTAIHAH